MGLDARPTRLDERTAAVSLAASLRPRHELSEICACHVGTPDSRCNHGRGHGGFLDQAARGDLRGSKITASWGRPGGSGVWSSMLLTPKELGLLSSGLMTFHGESLK